MVVLRLHIEAVVVSEYLGVRLSWEQGRASVLLQCETEARNNSAGARGRDHS